METDLTLLSKILSNNTFENRCTTLCKNFQKEIFLNKLHFQIHVADQTQDLGHIHGFVSLSRCHGVCDDV
jgi:hypothetical protein